MTELQFLIDQMRRMYEGRAWHGPSIREALDGVTLELATKRVGQSSHSIYDLVHHMAAWIGEVHARVGGRPPQYPTEGDFPSRVSTPTEADWKAVCDRLDTQQATLLADLEFLDPARLSDLVGTANAPSLGTGPSVLAMLHGLIQHNAYHAGQVVLIRRALGA
ncbi:MAG: DinB family protein [Gemmatimonadaceae bacterium]